MSVGSMICQYIYSSFLLLRAALEAAIPAAEVILENINIFFNAMMNTVATVIDVALSGYIKLLENTISMFADMILSKLPNKMFCSNMFKCVFLLEQLCDSTSVTFKAMQKYGFISSDSRLGFSNSTQEKIDFLRTLMHDYATFSETVCNFGFAFSLSLDSLKAIMAEIMQKVNAFIKFLTRKKNALLNLIQRYIDFLKEAGILDLLKKLTAFFKCVIDLFDSTCTAIDTSKSFYNNALKKLNIEETSNGYTFNRETRKQYNTFLDSREKQLHVLSNRVKDVFDLAITGMGVRGASNSYNLANLLQGGDIKDLEHTWRKTKVGSYFIAKSRDFKRIFFNTITDPENTSMTYDYILNGMSINEATGEVTVVYGDNKLVINDSNYWLYGFRKEEVPADEQIEPLDENFDLNSYVIDPNTDEIMSARRAGFKASKNPLGPLSQYLQSINNKVSDGIPEYELVNAWEK